MENNMKQFDLQEYLAHPERKVVTRDGRETRIICTDMKGTSMPILGLVKKPEAFEEKIICYTPEGRAAYLSRDLDIFFAEEDARKHEGWINLPALTPEEQGDLPHPFKIPVFETEAKAREARENVERCRIEIGDSVHNYSVKIEWEE